MKKIAKIVGIALLSIVALMAIVPVAFKGKIKELVITEGNKFLNAEFGFDRLNISLFREFPQASVSLKGFYLKGIEEFAEDTLIYVGNAEVAVNVMSVFGNAGFDITKVLLEDTDVKAIVLADGRPNWDVMKTTSDVEEEKDTTATTLSIQLKKLSVDNLNIIYDDRQSDMYARIEQFTASCSGDMAANRTALDLKAAIQALTFKAGGVALLNQAHIGTHLNIDADFENGTYTLNDNWLSLNAIKASIDGWVAMPTDAPMSMDITLNSSEISFKEILSLIPAIYAKDFEELQANGTVSLQAFAKGQLVGDSIVPQFEAALMVKDGAFRYPALPAGINDIQLSAKVNNPGGALDLTQIDLERFSLNMLSTPFALSAKVSTPISDPAFTLTANGKLNLGDIAKVYPLEDMTLNGTIKADMSFGGRLSYLEQEQYERFTANGSLNLYQMQLQMEGIPHVSIEKSTFAFTPRYLNLNDTQVLIGDNDIAANCRFENYMGFALKGETLKGQLNILSNHLDMNDFMTSSEEESNTEETLEAEPTKDAETSNNGVLVVPKNIDFDMNVNMKEILFSGMTINNMEGKLTVNGGKAHMSNLSMNTLGGKVVMNGAYSTANSEIHPELDAAFAMTDISFAQAFKELVMIQQMAPIFEKLNGNFSGKISIDTQLDETMSPMLQTLTASGNLSTRDLNLTGVEVIDKIADATHHTELKQLSAKDLNINFTIKNGRIATQPFELKMGNMGLILSGTTGLDQSIDYTGKLRLPSSTSGINTIDFKIGGQFKSPSISIDTKSIAKQAANTATEKAVEAAAEKLGIDLKNAEKQKEELVQAAQDAANKLVEEAEKQKANLVNKAGNNAIKKLAAEKAGDALITEAKKKGEQLVAEAERKGNSLIQRAQQ